MEATGQHDRPLATLSAAAVEGTPATAARSSLQRALFDDAFDAMLLANDSGSYTDCNAAACSLFGVSRQGLLRRNVYDLRGSSLGASGGWQQFLNAGSAEGHFRLLRSDGEYRDVGYRATANVIPKLHLSVFRDMTDTTVSKQAHELAARQAAIIEAFNDAIISSDLDGLINSWNPGAARLYGFSPSEVLAKGHSLLIPPDILSFEGYVVQRVLRGEIVEQYDTQRLRKDGSVLEVSLTVSATRDSTGRISGVAQIARDLTERRIQEASARRVEEQLSQAQKMEAVGALAGGVAHDFNNALSIILTYTILVLEELKPDDPLRSDLEEVRCAAERAAELTRQLLALGRQQVLQPRVLDLAQVVLRMENTLRRAISENIELTILASSTPARISADSSQMEQVVMNLVVNACEAMPRSGKLTLQTNSAELDSDSAETLDVPAGSYVVLAVSDTGRGMDAGMLARIYDPFFTTKEKSKRTGLGLAAVFGIVKQSRGHIGVWSEPGQGTTFRVYFPRTDRALDVASASAPPTVLRGSETILVVEDDEQVRMGTGAVLRRHGYQVLDAANGTDALLICQRFAGPIDLLLTDVVMPHMSGRELADRLAPIRPETSVVYTSGHSEDSIVHHGVLDASIAFLAKPIIPANLLLKVREVLDARPSLLLE